MNQSSVCRQQMTVPTLSGSFVTGPLGFGTGLCFSLAGFRAAAGLGCFGRLMSFMYLDRKEAMLWLIDWNLPR